MNETRRAALEEMPLVAILRGIEPEEVDAVFDALLVAGFLSGVLLGEEGRVMRRARPNLHTVLLVGAEGLCVSYELALGEVGIAVRRIESEAATLAGLLDIAARHRSA